MISSDVEGGLDEVEIGDKETSQEALVHIRKDAGLSVPRNYCSEWSQHRDLNPYLQNLTPLFPRGRKLAQQSCILFKSQSLLEGFAGSSNSKESACNARDSGLIPGSGISPGEGTGNALQYSCLGNSMARGVWWATVHGIAKSQTRLRN